MTLILETVAFPDRTIHRDWYAGGNGSYVCAIHLIRCDFVAIAAGSFSSASLRLITELHFKGQQLMQFAAGWASGLTLNELVFINCILVNMEHYFFGRNHIRNVVMSNVVIKQKKLVDIFGVGHRGDLFSVKIVHYTALQQINACDFSALCAVRYLRLPRCGIESITSRAFNHMIDLIEIDLSNNRLKTLPTHIFDVLLEKRYFLAVNLSHNRWECQCNLLHVHNALQEYGIVFNDFPANCSMPLRSLAGTRDRQHCHNDTMAVNASVCRSHYGFNFIFVTMPRVSIRIDATYENINVRTEHTMLVYLLTLHQTGGQTGNAAHITTTIATNEFVGGRRELPVCYRLRASNATNFILPKSHHQINSIFCILHSKQAMNAIWPINCMSICKNCKTEIWLRISSAMWFVPAMVFLFLTIVGIGIGSGYCLLRFRPQLLIGAVRVVVLRNPTKERRHSFTIFVMPSNWQDGQNTQRYAQNIHICNM